MKIPVRLVATILISAIVLYALHRKGEVIAAFKVLGVEFSLDAKEPTIESKR
jgi:hypothetical protein